MAITDHISLLIRSLEIAGVEIRSEACEGDGGLVRLEDKRVFFVNPQIPADKTLENCIAALKKFDTELIPLPPKVRTLLGEEEWGKGSK